MLVRPGAEFGATQLSLGITHTQDSPDADTPAEARSAKEALLRRTPRLQNHHIMGWGALNPEPAPGEYTWSSLDGRMDLIQRTGGTPIITLCCAPDWMKGGELGETDWSRLEDAPHPEHFQDFAQLAARVADRYPEVAYFQVWNELKGFHDPDRNRWDIESYTELYNRVYAAVKAVTPDARIGGPYVPVDSWSNVDGMSHPSELTGPWGTVDQRALDAIAYWLDHHDGADFITFDMWTATNDRGLITDEMTATKKLSAVIDWVRHRTDLPIWIAEWYVLPTESAGHLEQQNAILTTAIAEMAMAGADAALLWGPQGSVAEDCLGCLWTVASQDGLPEATPALESMDSFARAFPPNTVLLDFEVESDDVTVLLSEGHVLFVNRTADPLRVALEGEAAHALDPYEVRIVERSTTPAGSS